jgi:nucleotide-binding universal stress UspA family protein
MSKIERILVATDLSAQAGWAETRAGMLAKQLGASIDLLHVVDSTSLQALRQALIGTADPDQVMASLRAEVEKAAAELETEHAVSVRRHVQTGKPPGEILWLAQQCSSQLVVAGAHGRHPLHRLLFGSTTERLLYRTELPLLIVKRSPRAPYRLMLAGVDFSACAARAVRFARELLPAADLLVYHAVESPFEGWIRLGGVEPDRIARHRAETIAEAESQMLAFMDAAGLERGRTLSHVEYGYPVARLEAQVETTRPDLLVVGKHGRSALESWMVGSVTAHMAHAAGCDVLIVPEAGA